jgi:excisionase family DNA binding protein
MSSNIQIQRICQFCGKEFIAKTTVTKYCGDVCAKKAYKARIKSFKVEDSNTQTFQLKCLPNERLIEIGAKDYLNIEESCLLLSVSRWTLWRMIKDGRITATKLGRLTRIKRLDIDEFFNQPVASSIVPLLDSNTEFQSDITECYTLTEIHVKYGISESALQNLIKRNNIQKMKSGKCVYVPKSDIERLLGIPHTLF